jgi:hypothetical protein
MSRTAFARWTVADLDALPAGCFVKIFRKGILEKRDGTFSGLVCGWRNRKAPVTWSAVDCVIAGVSGVFLPDGVPWRAYQRPSLDKMQGREVAA